MSSDNKERTLNNLKNDSEFSLLIDELVLCVGVANEEKMVVLNLLGSISHFSLFIHSLF